MFYQTFWRGGGKKEKQLAFGWLLTACLGLLDFSALKGKVLRGLGHSGTVCRYSKGLPKQANFCFKES